MREEPYPNIHHFIFRYAFHGDPTEWAVFEKHNRFATVGVVLRRIDIPKSMMDVQ